MSNQELEEKKFRVIVEFINYQLADQAATIDDRSILKSLQHPDLADSRVLLRLIKESVVRLNEKIKAKRDAFKKLNYTPTYLKSKLFDGIEIPHAEIDKLLSDFPDHSASQIARKLYFTI